MFSAIVAEDYKYGIAKDGKLPWKNSYDQKWFKSMTLATQDPTKQNVVVMGRKTWDSIGQKPLPGRINIVLSKSHSEKPTKTTVWAGDQSHCMAIIGNLLQKEYTSRVFIIGGAQIYSAFLKHYSHIYINRIKGDYKCDLQNPLAMISTNEWSQEFSLTGFYDTQKVSIEQYTRNGAPMYKFLLPTQETSYLALMQRLLKQPLRTDRTGVGTHSLFSQELHFDLNEGFPLLTCKFVPFRLIVEELLFFLSGSTDATKLQAKKVHIWDGNTSREFLDSKGFTKYKVGDMGPMYGFQWRHCGAEYKGCNHNYMGQGIDQIVKIEHLLKTDPTSRRIILSAYNVADLPNMVLDPCHCMIQFYVNDKRQLCAKLTQRSADLFLGVPFNIASYAILTHMLAFVCKLNVGTLTMSFGDVHLYSTHVEAATKLTDDFKILPFPDLYFRNRDQKTVDDFTMDDIQLRNYVSGPRLKVPMAV